MSIPSFPDKLQPVDYTGQQFKDVIRPPDISVVGATSAQFTASMTIPNVVIKSKSENLVVFPGSRSNPTVFPSTITFGVNGLVQIGTGLSASGGNQTESTAWLLRGDSLADSELNTPTDIVITRPSGIWGSVATAIIFDSDRLSENDFANMPVKIVSSKDGSPLTPHSVSYTPTFAHSSIILNTVYNDNLNLFAVSNPSHEVLYDTGDGLEITGDNRYMGMLGLILKESGMTTQTFSWDSVGATTGAPAPTEGLYNIIEIPGKPIRVHSINGEKLGKRLLDHKCNMMFHADSLFAPPSDNRLCCPIFEKSPIPIRGLVLNVNSGNGPVDTRYSILSAASNAGVSVPGQQFDLYGPTVSRRSLFHDAINPAGASEFSVLPMAYGEHLFTGDAVNNLALSYPGYFANSGYWQHQRTFGMTHNHADVVDWQDNSWLFDTSLTTRGIFAKWPHGVTVSWVHYTGGVQAILSPGPEVLIGTNSATVGCAWGDVALGGLDETVTNADALSRSGGRSRVAAGVVETSGGSAGIITFGQRLWSPSASGIQVGQISYGGTNLDRHINPNYLNRNVLADYYEATQTDTPVHWMSEGYVLETAITKWKQWVDVVRTAVNNARVNDPTIQEPLIVIVANWPSGNGVIEDATNATRVYESELARIALENDDVVFINMYRMAKDRFGEYGSHWNGGVGNALLSDTVHPSYVGGCAFAKMYYTEAIQQAIKKFPGKYTNSSKPRFVFNSNNTGMTAVRNEVPNIIGSMTEDFKLSNIKYSIHSVNKNAHVRIQYSGASEGLGYTGTDSQNTIMILKESGQKDMRDSGYGIPFDTINDFSGTFTVTPVNMDATDSYSVILDFE